MADNFNLALGGPSAEEQTAAGLMPGQPGLNLGNNIYANSQAQQEQSQLVQQAIEKTKQAKIGTAESQTIFDTQAYLSEKGLMPKAQAIAELKLVLSRQGASNEEISKDLQTAQDEFPEELDGQAIWRFYSALREPKAPAAISASGQAFQATGKEKDVNGDAFPQGTWIQEKADSEGNQVFVHSNEPAAQTNATAKAGGASGKELKEFGKEIDGMMKTRFGATGQLATTIFRADRALNTLHSSSTMTKQDLNNVSTDIAAIYQGGVPGQTQIVENAYGTTLTNLMDTLRHYTGVLSGFGMNQGVLNDTKSKLTQVLTDMRNSAIASMKQIFEGVVAHYPTLSPQDPAVVNVIEETMKGLTSGLLNAQGQVLPPSGSPPMAGAAPAPGAAAPAPQGQPQAQKTPSGISYTVS